MNEYKEIYDYFNKKDEKHKQYATDVSDAMKMLSNTLKSAAETELKSDIGIACDDENENEEKRLKEYRATIRTVRQQLENCLNLFAGKVNENESLQENDKNVDNTSGEVDINKPHYIDEDFTGKKVCGFRLDSKSGRINVKDAQDMLVNVCNILNKENPQKFSGFLNNPKYRSFKNPKFVTYHESKGHKRTYYKQLERGGICVFVNDNVNDIMKLIKNILIDFGYNPKEFEIFIRSDKSLK